MSNHLSKSLFSIPRLKKSRSRQQNQPENPTSLCLNALTSDDAFLRFAAALGEPFFSSRNPERNFIIFLCIPLPPRPFAPHSPNGILFSTLHILRPRAIFTLEKHQRELFFLASPICRGLFHPLKAPKGVLFLTLHSPSAATFFIPMQPRTEFYFLTLHPSPLSRGPRLQRCITIFSVLSAAFHHAGHRVTLHAEYIQRSCPKCVAQRRNGEIFPPANATAATHRGAGTAIQDEYKKKLYPSARRGIYYTGIIGGGRGGRGYNNMEIWDGRERAGDIIIWKYMTAESARGIIIIWKYMTAERRRGR